ncbi:hypothetical protein BW685_23440 [Burkholderia ubonensis]|uniref:Uncharacterized protein n=1 Tax=Burkholderia ubonensis TaxID=101571 RepID=A0A1R1J6S6_9BURK|nr:hypothetical protein BW685_23440 [Burkholderia ubonensis]
MSIYAKTKVRLPIIIMTGSPFYLGTSPIKVIHLMLLCLDLLIQIRYLLRLLPQYFLTCVDFLLRRKCLPDDQPYPGEDKQLQQHSQSEKPPSQALGRLIITIARLLRRCVGLHELVLQQLGRSFRCFPG